MENLLLAALTVPGTLSEIHTPTAAVSDYTAAVIIQGIFIGFLVTLLLMGGFLLLNIGLLSKRREDRIGPRAPSDVNLLRDSVWPNDPERRAVLPADEDSEVGTLGNDEKDRVA